MKIHWLDILLIGVLVFALFKIEAALRRWWYRRHRPAPVRFASPGFLVGQVQGAVAAMECTNCSESTSSYSEYSNGAKLCPNCAASILVVKE